MVVVSSTEVVGWSCRRLGGGGMVGPCGGGRYRACEDEGLRENSKVCMCVCVHVCVCACVRVFVYMIISAN